jgi:hypothetical protein
MKQLIMLLAFSAILFAGNVYAQKNAKTTKFSSVYTNLNKDCKTIRGGDGQDDAAYCKGVGGYKIYVGAAAAALSIAIQTPEKENIGDIPMQGFDYDTKKINVEWRLADGKPFAVIIRIFTYSDEKANEFDYFGKKIGEELKIVGLKGFAGINFNVDAKTTDANVKARELNNQGSELPKP